MTINPSVRHDDVVMVTPITEWEFTADAASWINEILVKSPRLPFSRAKCEQRGSGSAKCHALTFKRNNPHG